MSSQLLQSYGPTGVDTSFAFPNSCKSSAFICKRSVNPTFSQIRWCAMLTPKDDMVSARGNKPYDLRN